MLGSAGTGREGGRAFGECPGHTRVDQPETCAAKLQFVARSCQGGLAALVSFSNICTQNCRVLLHTHKCAVLSQRERHVVS